jgi:hypothetical protein
MINGIGYRYRNYVLKVCVFGKSKKTHAANDRGL